MKSVSSSIDHATKMIHIINTILCKDADLHHYDADLCVIMRQIVLI